MDDRYEGFATITGTLDQCRDCGALVGDRRVHDEWHDGDE